MAGNEIGTDSAGTASLPNGGIGIDMSGNCSNNTIGGTTDEGNVISGNGSDGIQIYGSNDNIVAGNEIGTDSPARSPRNQTAGVRYRYGQGSSNNTIGGTTAVAGNLIANNSGPGVDVTRTTSVGNQITANRIFGNLGQAIDLGNDGVTYNATSPRQGPNDLQNFPIIVTNRRWPAPGLAERQRARHDLPHRRLRQPALRPGGSGEAQDYLGSMEVTTDGEGQVVFAVPFTPPAGLPIVTATATDPEGNTSEVSAPRRAALETPPPPLRIVPNQSLVFSAATGDGFAIEDPDAGPAQPGLEPDAFGRGGHSTLSNTAGLTGSGDGTGSLSYSGPLSAVNAALGGHDLHPARWARTCSPRSRSTPSPAAPRRLRRR